jgi:DNA helicase-2/ATP-dependent DNA helicase PcrA
VSAELNPAQRAAVEHDLGPLLVLAGAGSGKTRVVTQRIARLIQRGVSARNILAMTFTNKAAGEMHERVVGLVGTKVAKDLTVSTFHRFGLTVIGAETRAFGIRGNRFAIFDQADASSAVREILREIRTGRSYDVGAILGRISAAKNAFVEPEQWENAERDAAHDDPYDEISSLVYGKYLGVLRAQQAFDFDDLICEVVRLWRRRTDVLERWRDRYRYVIVDEYQDTNHAQLELTLLLGGGHRNVCVVGDDDQSIYAWRGADVRNILDFEEHFPGAKIVKLQENYRSSKAILDVAGVVLANATGKRHPKSIVSTRPDGERVVVVVASDPEVEASFVASETKRLLDEVGLRPRDVAVLYRSNLQAPEIESALKERQLPYRMIGGNQMYERKEVKDLVAYLRVAVDPNDELSLRRVLNYPARGIGEGALSKLSAQATATDAQLWTVLLKPHAIQGLAGPALEGCRDFVRIIEGARARLDAGAPCADVARGVIEDVKLREDIFAASTPEVAARRWGNVESLLKLFARRDEQGKGGRTHLAELLRILALREDGEEERGTDRITLTTMHGAKGLEFRAVFVVGLEEGLVPHARATDPRATDVALPGGDDAFGSHSLDEERRLFYVAVTRARDRLYLCRAELRGMRGKLVRRAPSRFLAEIPPAMFDERHESSPVAPGIAETKAGADGVLAAILGGLPGGVSGELPMIPRRRS